MRVGLVWSCHQSEKALLLLAKGLLSLDSEIDVLRQQRSFLVYASQTLNFHTPTGQGREGGVAA